MAKVYLYSYGGTCTRMFYEHLKSNGVEINAQDNVHYGTPPETMKPGETFIYLYGDPCMSILSFYNKRMMGDVWFLDKHAQNLRLKKPVSWSFTEYVEEGKDQFKLTEHYNKYKSIYQSIRGNKIFVNCDFLWHYQDKIHEIVGIEAAMPPKQPRSRKGWLNIDSFYKLEEIYSDLSMEMSNIDPFIYEKVM